LLPVDSADKEEELMASPVRSYVLITLLGFLVIKLGFTGLFLFADDPTMPWTFWGSQPALAKDEQNNEKKNELANETSEKTSVPNSEAPDLNRLKEEIASLETHLKAINADIDKYFKSAASETRISPMTLEQKRLQVEKERRQLKKERERLDALKKEIDSKLAKLTEIQTVVQGELDKKKVIQDSRLKHLIKIYTTMPPKKAAMLIDKLEMEVIIALFSRMKGDSVGQILPHVSPGKAAKISERLAKLRH
jgi:flagellar motility protein MotE (MotC chaperone)